MVKDTMRFDSFCDFYYRRERIRKLYIGLSRDEKTWYKYYVYSRRIMRDKVCNLIWEYLNSADDEEHANCIRNLDKERSKYL